MDFKEYLNEQSLGTLAAEIEAVHPAFDRRAFLAQVFDDAWPAREMKARIRHVVTVLGACLPADYRAALDLLARVLPRLDGPGLLKLVFPDYVEVYGLDDWEASLAALETFTQHISAEFAVRPFIVRYPEQTLARMLAWTGHASTDVRRLASEGCRPRLPWGMRLTALVQDPAPILPILARLKNDESDWVRKSVANNLNEIAKDHPDLVLDLLRDWQAGATGEESARVRWISGHALRTLVKRGHPGALALLGYGAGQDLAVHNLAVEPAAIALGGEVTLSFDVESLSAGPLKLMIDYAVYHRKSNGRLSPKVFKLAKKTIRPGETLHVEKKHSFVPVTIRTYYPGEQAIEVQINGQPFGRVGFVLLSC